MAPRPEGSSVPRARFLDSSAICLIVVLTSAALVLARPARALECDPTICQGNPCTIEGAHALPDGCFLDFGGVDVTIAPDALMIWPERGSEGGISARNLTIRGSVIGRGGDLELDAEEDLVTARSPGKGMIAVADAAANQNSYAFGAYLEIYAGTSGTGGATLGGSIVSLSGHDVDLYVEAPTIEVDSPLKAAGVSEAGGEFNEIDLIATAGGITVRKPIRVRSENLTIPVLYLQATGDIVVESPVAVHSASGSPSATIFGNASIMLEGKIQLDAATFGGFLNVAADQDILLAGDVSARGVTDSGQVALAAGGTAIVTARKVDTSWNGATRANPEGSGFSVAADSVVLKSKVLARGGVPNTISYEQSLDVTGASVLGDRFSRNIIACPCVDSDGDGFCDGGCLVPPLGLGEALFRPSPVFIPLP
jgi:hypothetical protein